MLKKFNDFLNESVDHAAKIRAAADKHHQKMIKRSDGQDEKNFHNKDHRDIHAIADHVAKGEFKKAADKTYKLDTAAKDIIPKAQYNHIFKKAGGYA